MQDAVAEKRNAERLPLEKFKEMQVLNLHHGKKTPDIAALFHGAHSPAHEKRAEMAAVLFPHGQTAPTQTPSLRLKQRTTPAASPLTLARMCTA